MTGRQSQPPSRTPQAPGAPAPHPVDAATVILVRDRPGPADDSRLEIYLVQRHADLKVAGGRFVFPGGKVDDADSDPMLTDRCEGLSRAAAAAILNEASNASPDLGYWVAALRELFEEAGILLAYEPDGRWVDNHAPRYHDYRALLREGSLCFADIVAREDLTLAARSLHYYAHWITPVWVARRFNARFFVAPLPPGQEPMHDQAESVNGIWTTPHEALGAIGDGQMLAMFATQTNLRHISASATVEELLQAAARRTIQPMLPRKVIEEGAERLVLPGQPGYEDGV